MAPSTFKPFAGDLLVGNFGDGKINAFDPSSGAFLGTLSDDKGNPLVNDGLWGLKFGNDNPTFDPNALYFTAGGAGEDTGVFGRINSVPEPSSAVLGLIAMGVLAGGWRWMNRRRRRGPDRPSSWPIAHRGRPEVQSSPGLFLS